MGSMLGSTTDRMSPAWTALPAARPFPSLQRDCGRDPIVYPCGGAALCIPSAAKSIPSVREPQLLGTMSLCRHLLQNLKTRRVCFGSSSPGRALLEMLDASGDEQGEEKHSLDGEVWLG